MSDSMKAISVTRTWAHLLVAGVKPVENRTWRTDYCGPLLIHASKIVQPALDEALAIAAADEALAGKGGGQCQPE